jgi:dephospho-CoA kinase
MRRNCPVCGVESVKGKACNYHLHQSLTPEAQRAASEAVRLGNKRTEYQREYYWRHAEKLRDRRREHKREMYRLRKLTKPIIEDLCKAIDLARQTANW